MRTKRHGRIAYGGYFEGPRPVTHPDPVLWLLDPDMAAAFPTDSDLVLYAVMPTIPRLPEFRADPEAALKAIVASVPEATFSSCLAPGRRGHGQDRHDHRYPCPHGSRPPALAGDAAAALVSAAGHRLRLRIPVRRMARRQHRPGDVGG